MKAKKKPGPRPRGTARVKEAAGVHHPAIKVAAPPTIDQIAEKFVLRQETLSRMTGFSLRAVAGWSSGKTPSAPVKRALVEMDRLLDQLSRLMKPKDAGRWLKEPYPALDGFTPVQVIERGQTDRIWRLLYFSNPASPVKRSFHSLSRARQPRWREGKAVRSGLRLSRKLPGADAPTALRCERSESTIRITRYE